MATHDYVIANGTGAAVRSDLNDALAAIVSNNSGSSEPATTYAYQWWADTTANVLKIRNSANNAWITLRELDGTMLIEDGSASAPGLSFASDTNSGLFGGSDTIGFATGGAERLEIGSSEVVFNDPSNDVDFRVESNGQTHMLFVDAGNDRVGIATSSPGTDLDVNNGSANCTIRARTATGFSSFLNLLPNGSGTGVQLASNADSSSQLFNQLNSYLAFGTNNTEKVRIDSSGNLGINETSPSTKFHLTGVDDNFITIDHATRTGSWIIKHSGENSESLEFQQNNGSTTVRSYLAGRDVHEFHTGGSERMRILSSGGITFNGDTATANALDDYEEGTWTPGIGCTGQSGSFTLPIRQGFYTKIGRVVHLQFRITWSAIPSVGGHLYLEGFPFAYPATTGQGEFGAGVAFKSGLNSDSYVSMLGSTTGGGSRTAVKFWDSAGSAINVTTGNNIASSGDVRGSLTYMV